MTKPCRVCGRPCSVTGPGTVIHSDGSVEHDHCAPSEAGRPRPELTTRVKETTPMADKHRRASP
jgi:hypothetical protein